MAPGCTYCSFLLVLTRGLSSFNPPCIPKLPKGPLTVSMERSESVPELSVEPCRPAFVLRPLLPLPFVCLSRVMLATLSYTLPWMAATALLRSSRGGGDG